ncbi:MAG: pyrroline-5-carboxylate reductase [Paracoccaceae bacterium]
MLNAINTHGLLLLGCGKMGGAMLAGWLERGVKPSAVWVIDPHPSDQLRGLLGAGLNLNTDLPEAPAICVIAVKPQMMGAALPAIAALANRNTVFVSIAAGTTLAALGAALGTQARIIRAMPNTPAAVGRGITAIIGNANASQDDLDLAEDVLKAVGQVVRLETEAQIDAVTAVSGSGPAYVFHLIETMAAAGEAQGLPPEMALHLARATVAGAGALAENAPEDPGQLRVNVTSPNGTTAAALAVLMDAETGFPALLNRAIAAAANRARELGAS